MCSRSRFRLDVEQTRVVCGRGVESRAGARPVGRRWRFRRFRPGPQSDAHGYVPPALRTRRADFRHRALQWNHAARTVAGAGRPGGRPASTRPAFTTTSRPAAGTIAPDRAAAASRRRTLIQGEPGLGRGAPVERCAVDGDQNLALSPLASDCHRTSSVARPARWARSRPGTRAATTKSLRSAVPRSGPFLLPQVGIGGGNGVHPTSVIPGWRPPAGRGTAGCSAGTWDPTDQQPVGQARPVLSSAGPGRPATCPADGGTPAITCTKS